MPSGGGGGGVMEASAAEALLVAEAAAGDPELQALAPSAPAPTVRRPHPRHGPAQPQGGHGWRWRPPWFTIAVSIVEVVAYACVDARHALVFNPGRRREAWRFVSYMLVHSGALHLALNVAIQLLLATPLETEQGCWRTALVYLGGGLAGSLGTSLLEPDLCIEGASAGVYALLISQLANIWLNYRALRYKVYRGVSVAVLLVADVGFSLHHHYATGNKGPRICWAAHAAGALAGLLLGLAAFRAQPKPGALEPPAFGAGWPRIAARVAALALLGAAFCAALACNLLRPDNLRLVTACPRPS